MRLAKFDTQRHIPDQVWYDSLRGSDDGSFSKVSARNPYSNIDYQMSKNSIDREDYLKQKVLSKPIIGGTLVSPRGFETAIGSPRSIYTGLGTGIQGGTFTQVRSPRGFDMPNFTSPRSVSPLSSCRSR